MRVEAKMAKVTLIIARTIHGSEHKLDSWLAHSHWNPFNVCNMLSGNLVLGTCFIDMRRHGKWRLGSSSNRWQPMDILVWTPLIHSLALRPTHAFITLSSTMSYYVEIGCQMKSIYNYAQRHMKWILLIRMRDYERVKMVNGLRLMSVHWPIIGINTYSVMRSILILCTTAATAAYSVRFIIINDDNYVFFFAFLQTLMVLLLSITIVHLSIHASLRIGIVFVMRFMHIWSINEEMRIESMVCDEIVLTNHQNMNRCLDATNTEID